MEKDRLVRSAKKTMSLLLALVMMGSGIIGIKPSNAAEDADTGSAFVPVENAGIETSKSISYDAATGGYTLRMENFVTGSTITTAVTTMKATDFVLATDLSHSMPYCINCGDNATVDNVTTGEFRNRSYCRTYALDIDTSLVYYTTDNMSTALYYCQSCERWYTEQHTGESHGGTEYLPAYYSGYWTASEQSASNTHFDRFYSQYGNVYCTGGVSCTEHKDWRHPIYADQLDYSVEYTRSPGSTSGDNRLAWCDVCQVWRRCSTAANTSHADGGDHKLGHAYYPHRTAEDNDTDTKVCIFRPPCVSRMTAAKNAISAFVDEVYRMSLGPDGITGTDDDVLHRVAIVGFGGNNNDDPRAPIETEDKEFTRTGIYSIWDSDIYASEGTDVNNFKSYFVFGEKGNGTPGAEADKADYYYSHALRDVTSSKEMEVIQEGISELSYNYGTYVNLGMEIAKGIFSSTYTEDPDNTINRNRVAVVFTDGKPDGDNESSDYDLADESIQPSYDIKNSTTYGATVYTVGCFANANASLIWPLENNAKEDEYMHMLSSNYPTAWEFYETGSLAKDAYVKRDPASENVEENWSHFTINDVNPNLLQRDENGNLVTDDSGNYVLDTTKSGYYLTAANADELVNAFEGIATESATGGASVSLDTETVVQDTLSDEWEINGDISGAKAYTMTYTADSGDTKVWESTATDTSFTPTLSGKTVQVTGFDFSANYVGKDVASDGTATPRGKKLVLEIPVKPADGNTGGTAQLTNDPAQSGIIYDGEVQEHFGSPKVDVPTTVTLEVLTVGDSSAVFDFNTAAECMDGYQTDAGGNGNYLRLNGETVSYNSSLAHGGTDEFSDVIVGSYINLCMTAVNGYRSEFSVDGGITWSELSVDSNGVAYSDITVTPAMHVIVRNTMEKADLTITKTLAAADPDQSFIFTVSGSSGVLQVVIPSTAFAEGETTASVTVKNVDIGDYTVTEQVLWPHRYTLDTNSITALKDTDATVSGNGITVTVTPDGETVTFKSARTDPYWLSGDCWAEYRWGADGVVKFE